MAEVEHPTRSRRSAASNHRGLILGLIALGALGVLVSFQPFTGDQALFASGARQLAHGDVLYRDVWDVKQPGIYAFYLGAARSSDTAKLPSTSSNSSYSWASESSSRLLYALGSRARELRLPSRSS